MQRRPLSRFGFGAAAALLALLGSSGCRKEAPEASTRAAPSAATSAKPIDRLAPGELEAGEGSLFGLSVPRGMTVQGKFRDFAVAIGPVRAEAVVDFVRQRVAVERVELGAAGTVFPAVRIHGAAPERTYRIEVTAEDRATRLLVRDITPQPPPPKVEGLTTEELWKRAGFTANGQPVNLKALE
jgi:hypothetical protein